MAKFKLPSRNAMLFNGAAVLVVGASVAVVARSMLFVEQIAPCVERYEQAARFSLDRNGTPMATSELQSRLGNTDWGLHDGARVVRLKSGPGKHALEIDLARVSTSADASSPDSRPGVGFVWAPRDLREAKAACLSYSVFLPNGFVFGKAGRLPGLMGVGAEGDTEKPAFSTRFTFGAAGKADILAQVPLWADPRPLTGTGGAFSLQKGRWVSLEQEIVLNTPGRKDGTLRVWLDGNVVLNRNEMVFRARPDVRLAGVLAESTAGEAAAGAQRKSQKVWMTPFELRWR